ncbi:MAG: hypothetical protein U9M91_01570 [Chloroflexota bacterium]|nr:hypothetical protein [Chloroflexota bacterium]
MTKGTIPRKLRYFVARFGAKHIGTDPVEGGCYPLPPKYWPSNWYPYNAIREGDVVLLFCGKNYPGHRGEIAGIGIVYHIDEGHDEDILWYHYMSLARPIDNRAICTRLAKTGCEAALNGILKAGHSPYRFLFMIENECACALLAGCQINWP